jgi:hypothetical protein
MLVQRPIRCHRHLRGEMSEPDGQHWRRKKATNRMSPEVKVEARFPGALRADLNERLAGLGRDELKQVLRRTAAGGENQPRGCAAFGPACPLGAAMSLLGQKRPCREVRFTLKNGSGQPGPSGPRMGTTCCHLP